MLEHILPTHSTLAMRGISLLAVLAPSTCKSHYLVKQLSSTLRPLLLLLDLKETCNQDRPGFSETVPEHEPIEFRRNRPHLRVENASQAASFANVDIRYTCISSLWSCEQQFS